MSVGFLITSPYQIFHYKQIASHLDDVTMVCEIRETGFGLDEELIAAHMGDCAIEWIYEGRLAELDGRFDAIVCQTPVLPLRFMTKSLVVAQQYSLAKERYQYGVWRSQADLNLMYGKRSTDTISGFARAVAVGNPLLDPYWQLGYGKRRSFNSNPGRPRLLYAPTYGSLSSLKTVVPQLRDIDADITVKLHHAQDGAMVSGLRSDIEVVYSDADPALQFRDHDGVLSDVSGAVYDALYAGLPVVLTADEISPGSADYDRLSPAERDRSQLAAVTESWESGTDLITAFQAAQAKQETCGYASFLEETFVNPGSAGREAAAQIQRLLAEGPMPHFAADQIKETTRRYIATNRQLRGKGEDLLTGTPSPRPSKAPAARPVSPARKLYKRTRAQLARVKPLRTAARWRSRPVKGRAPAPASTAAMGDNMEPRPAHRRELVWEQLAPLLAEFGVQAARDSELVGATVAIRETDKRRFGRALHKLAEAHPQLHIRVGIKKRLGKQQPLSGLAEWELHAAEWCEIGGLTQRRASERDPAGCLTIGFAVYSPDRNRYLATRTVSERPDWTEYLDPDRTGGASVVWGTRPPHVASPVDVVYTWVDSRDPVWRKARADHGGNVESDIISANNHERYLDREELKHSLRSLWMYAPFVRRIFILTADQHPEWLSTLDSRITVVTHREVFPDPSVLPTFNSHAIESCLHRIPGLSENFLYFNDDVFLGREVTEEDFFTSAGLAKVRMSPSQFIYEGKPEADAIPTDWAAYNATALVARDFGQRFNYRVKHVPLALKKSVMTEIEARYAQELERTRRARFRSRTDLALPSMFAQYYAIATARAVEWPDQKRTYVYLDTGKYTGGDRFKWIIDWRPVFYCLNSTRFTEVDLAEQGEKLKRFYQRVLPYPAPWEIDPVDATAARRIDNRQSADTLPEWSINDPAHTKASADIDISAGRGG